MQQQSKPQAVVTAFAWVTVGNSLTSSTLLLQTFVGAISACIRYARKENQGHVCVQVRSLGARMRR